MDIYQAIDVAKSWMEELLPDSTKWWHFSQEEKDRYWALEMIVNRLTELLFEKDSQEYDE